NPLFQDGEQQGETLVVVTRGDSMCRPVRCAGGERLDLDEERSAPLHQRRHRRTAAAAVAATEKELGRVADRDAADTGHPEATALVNAAEAILRRTKDAVVGAASRLEVEDRIDDMLERLRASDPASLRDMADEQHGDAFFLG